MTNYEVNDCFKSRNGLICPECNKDRKREKCKNFIVGGNGVIGSCAYQ